MRWTEKDVYWASKSVHGRNLSTGSLSTVMNGSPSADFSRYHADSCSFSCFKTFSTTQFSPVEYSKLVFGSIAVESSSASNDGFQEVTATRETVVALKTAVKFGHSRHSFNSLRSTRRLGTLEFARNKLRRCVLVFV